MIQDLFTYSIEDFIPFTASAYWRLFVEMNASNLMLFPIIIVAVIGMINAAHRGHYRLLLGLLALVWAWVGYDFFLTRYSRLNWAGEFFAWAFWAQASLMVVVAAIDTKRRKVAQVSTLRRAPLTLVGLALIFPVFSLLGGRTLQSMEFVGFAPDPTVLLTLGLVLATRQRWFLLIIPTLWCGVGVATAWVL